MSLGDNSKWLKGLVYGKVNRSDWIVENRSQMGLVFLVLGRLRSRERWRAFRVLFFFFISPSI